MTLFSRRFVALALVGLCAVSTSFAAKICVDPGHGGSDPGAVGNGQQEKTNALNTSLKFRNWLNLDNSDANGGGSWTTIITRTTDVFVSLDGRCVYANNNGANRFCSIHNNACCGGTGTETFCAPSLGTSSDMRNKIQNRMVQAWGLANRGNKTANFYVLLNTSMPATLSELGFITNSYDAQFLGNATHQDKMAKYHLFALQDHYGIPAYTPGTTTPGAVTYTVDNSNAGFSVTGTWATASSSTDKFGADYRYRSTAPISEPAQWSANIATAGNYDISAWWSQGTNRSQTATYHMPDNAAVTVNQQANGGKWNLMATKSLAAGARNVKLSCWTTSGFIVIADAVKFYGPK